MHAKDSIPLRSIKETTSLSASASEISMLENQMQQEEKLGCSSPQMIEKVVSFVQMTF